MMEIFDLNKFEVVGKYAIPLATIRFTYEVFEHVLGCKCDKK